MPLPMIRRRQPSLPAPQVFLLPLPAPVRRRFRVTMRADGSVVQVTAASYERDGADYVFTRQNGTTARRIPIADVSSVELEA